MPENPIAGLYPQAAPPQQNALSGNPLGTIDAIMRLQQLGAQRAVGQAFQGAVSNGQFNPDSALTAIGNNPAAAYAASDGVRAALAARGANIANSSAALNLGVDNNKAFAAILAARAQKDNPTMTDLYDSMAEASRAGVDANTIAGWGAGANPKNVKQRISAAANYVMGPANAAGRINTVGPEGEEGSIPVGATTGGATPLQTTLSPTDKADQAEYYADQAKAAETMKSVRPLEQAMKLVPQLSHFSFGPGSKDISKISSFAQMLGLPVGTDLTDETSVRQEVNKKLLGYASSLIASGRSNEALETQIHANPSLDLTQPAVMDLLRSTIGMAKQDAALPGAAGHWRGYKDFKGQYYQNTDSDGFAINTMTPEQLAEKDKTLKGEDRKKFLRSLKIAQKGNFINPPPSATAPAAAPSPAVVAPAPGQGGVQIIDRTQGAQ